MSDVWKFFNKNDKVNERVSCNLCSKSYKTSGNTTNLATHLKIKHHFAYLQLKQKTVPVDDVPDNNVSMEALDVSVSIYNYFNFN